MKRTAYIFAMLIALTACQEELIQDISSDGFVGTIEDFADQTRTSLADGNYIAWSEGDRIAVFQGGADPDCFEVADASAGKTRASFEAVSTSGNDGQNQKYSENIAIYPYSSASSCLTDKVSGGKVLSYTVKPVNYPSIQSYKEDSFPTDALVMAAVTDGLSDRDLHFKAASAVLRFKVKGTTSLQSIKVTGNSDEPLSGNASVGVNTDGSSPTVSMTNTPSSVILDCGKGVALDESEATVFMLCIPPTDFAEGFTVTFTDTEGVEDVRTVSKSISVKQGHIFGMSEITFGQQSGSSGEYDYIDEYGINHGSGVEIDGVVWAPVNCGYHETDFKYGKLYQWGRKYGQGYSGASYDVSGNYVGTISDSAVPSVVDAVVSLAEAQSQDNEEIFYKAATSLSDVIYPSGIPLWNIGNETFPKKTEYDPCPEGWRVPTLAELTNLKAHKSSWTDSQGFNGLWFSGKTSYSSTAPRVFLCAAGFHEYRRQEAESRGLDGRYWSSKSSSSYAYRLNFDHNGNNVLTTSNSRVNGYSVRCVKDDGALVPVASVTLDKSFLTMDEWDTYTLSASISPSDANHQSAHWWSDDESVATVDQSGVVTAVSAGTATITAMAGMKIATCTVTVKDQSVAQEGDYIDEYGINHGQGVEIDGVVWAPVNCGYHKDDYEYGKLYQWGRKYGQGYDGNLYDVNGQNVGTYSDSSVPSIEEGGVSVVTGNHPSKENIFYIVTLVNYYDWVYPQDGKLWNSGTESKPVKTEYDPCPEGWRVPTYAELNELRQNRSSWTSKDGQNGYWFSGASSYNDKVPQVFFPAAGRRDDFTGTANTRGDRGDYWSSGPLGCYAYSLYFRSSYANMNDIGSRAYGYSVRCVQVID